MLKKPSHLKIPFVGDVPVYRYADVVKNSRMALEDPEAPYLYILRYPADEAFGEKQSQPLYVGIGCERRFAYHYLEAAGGQSYETSIRNRHKINSIRKIGRDEVLLQILTLDRKDAEDLEIRLIAYWGRRTCSERPGILTNLTAGGEGIRGISMPAHVKEKLTQRARNPIKFAGRLYEGLKIAFDDHTPEELASVFSTVFGISITPEDARCWDYGNFKQQLNRWSRQGYFPRGFNYLEEDGKERYNELPLEEFVYQREKIKSENRFRGYRLTQQTRYAHTKWRTPWGDFKTLEKAAETSNGEIQPSNLVRKFSLMRERNHFDPGFNILDENGVPQYQEQQITLKDRGLAQNSAFIANFSSIPMIVYGDVVPSRQCAFDRYEKYPADYFSFCQFVRRCIHFGGFPDGLNVTEAEGGPFPKIPGFFADHPLSDTYVRVCGHNFPSMQAASNELCLKRSNSLSPSVSLVVQLAI